MRRGVRHGWVLEPPRVPSDVGEDRFLREARRRWARARPVPLPGALSDSLARLRPEVRRSLALFERLRAGRSFQDELWSRLREVDAFAPAGVTVNLGDPREIEKVFANARRGGRVAARDLYAKLSWISHDERDPSLRIRFSFGSEDLLEWQAETRRASWADRFAQALFPECAAIAANAPLVGLVERLAGRRVRFSERIVYSNAPGGGASFHADLEPYQLGVVYGQLAGSTAWLALPRQELAEEVALWARRRRRARTSTARRALRALDREGAPELARLLDSTPSFTGALARRGALLVLRAGDALLLPSPGPERIAWHSVFALGSSPSLAHSYGIFARRR
jgi:hypothetical protein